METFQEMLNAYDKAPTNSEKGIVVGDFLDDVRREFKKGRLSCDYFETEPTWGSLSIEKQAVWAARVHALCNEFKISKPEWIFEDRYFLEHPHFAANAKGLLRVALICESPREFRIRNIFFSANNMTRV